MNFFGLRGLEGNPIVQVLKKHLEDVTRILEQGRYEVYSYAIAPGEAEEELEFDELINKLQLVPERDWKGTYIRSPSLVLPIKDLDAAQPVIDNFVALFPIFRAAINVFLGEEDRFEDYLTLPGLKARGFLDQSVELISVLLPSKSRDRSVPKR